MAFKSNGDSCRKFICKTSFIAENKNPPHLTTCRLTQAKLAGCLLEGGEVHMLLLDSLLCSLGLWTPLTIRGLELFKEWVFGYVFWHLQCYDQCFHGRSFWDLT